MNQFLPSPCEPYSLTTKPPSLEIPVVCCLVAVHSACWIPIFLHSSSTKVSDREVLNVDERCSLSWAVAGPVVGWRSSEAAPVLWFLKSYLVIPNSLILVLIFLYHGMQTCSHTGEFFSNFSKCYEILKFVWLIFCVSFVRYSITHPCSRLPAPVWRGPEDTAPSLFLPLLLPSSFDRCCERACTLLSLRFLVPL